MSQTDLQTLINDGGPAFPLPMGAETTQGSEGMTLRDWFTGQALTGMMLNSADMDFSPPQAAKAAAIVSYRIADAMIAVRNAGGAQ